MNLSEIKDFLSSTKPFTELIFIPIIALVVDFTQRVFFKRLHKHLQKTKSFWDDALCKSIPGSFSLLLWGMAIFTILSVFNKAYNGSYHDGISTVRAIFLVLVFTAFFLKVSKNLERSIINNVKDAPKGERHAIDQTTALALGKISQVVICLIGFLIALPTLGYSISGILAFGGAGALVISLAAQNLLSNFFGGLMIYLDRPFAIGDWIRSPDQNIEGTVEHMGWRVTRIRTFDKRPLYVPNSVFTKVSVENPSRMWNRRIKSSIGVRYCDINKVPIITERVKKYLRGHPEIDQNMTLIVAFNEFNSSSLDLLIYTFTKTTVWIRFHEIKQEVYLGIAKIIEEEGAEVAFPTSTIHLGDEELLENMQNKGRAPQ